MKKEKKQKINEKEIVLGKKIRDVKINERQHFLLYVSMLVLFNSLLIASAWFVLMYLTIWYNWVICVLVVVLFAGLSFKNYLSIKDFHKCSLFDNAISISSIWLHINVDLKDIYEMRVKESILDKIFKLKTKSLEVKILNRRRKKFTIHFIEEDAVKLKQEITILIDNYAQKQSKEINYAQKQKDENM